MATAPIAEHFPNHPKYSGLNPVTAVVA